MSLEHSQEYGAPSAVAVKREPTKEELERIAACFAVPYDDRVPRPADAPRLREVCEQFSVSIPTARKMLITAGMYSTHKSRQVIELLRQGKSIEEIIMLTGLKKSSINAYIPYRSELRGDPDIAASGDRRLKRKEAKRALLEGLAREYADAQKRDEAGLDELLWQGVLACQNCPLRAASGLEFKYTVGRGRNGEHTGELLVSRKTGSKTLTKSSVLLAFRRVRDQGALPDNAGWAPPAYPGPKAVGQIFGISYIYSLFWKLGLIRVPPAVERNLRGRRQP